MSRLLLGIAFVCACATAQAASYEAYQYLQTTSTSRNVTQTHIVNSSNEAQSFTGTLYNADGERLGSADTPLSTSAVAAKGRLIVSSADLEQLFGVSAWTGPATLRVRGSAAFDVMSKLTSTSGFASNTNCSRKNAVHNVEGFDSPNPSFVRFINTGVTTIEDIRGSLYNAAGESIGAKDQQLVESLAPNSATWLTRDDLSSRFGDTWNGEALLEITGTYAGLSLINLNSVNSETFFNFSCYETAAEVATPATARYRVTFTAEWSSSTHPNAYPSNAHFSPLIGAVHNGSVTFWESGGTATPGIESVAETGSTSTFRTEIDNAIAAGTTLATVSGGGIGSPATLNVEFDISSDYPLVTLITMIAPSPDWFLGVNALNLMEGGSWTSDLSVDLFAYDAGTEEGNGFSLSNAATSPQGTITRITESPFPSGGPRLGTFRFELISSN